jgi:branched-chain amino acid transport system substrate-binding protein
LVRAATTIALLIAVALSGCLTDGGSPSSSKVSGDRLTVYLSVPLHGLSAATARLVRGGARRALDDAGGRVGRFRIRLAVLDSTEPRDSLWNPGRVEANAERATDDPTAIAYLGELDYGGSAVSVPVTNKAGLLQVSPGDGLASLTVRPDGLNVGPERYYPGRRRTFLRLVPSDASRARVLLGDLDEPGNRLAIVTDRGVYGRELARQLSSGASRDGLTVTGVEEFDGSSDAVNAVAQAVAAQHPEAVVYAGATEPAAVRVLGEIGARRPDVRLIASGGFAAPGDAPSPSESRRPVEVLAPVHPADRYPPAGRRVLREMSRDGRPARPEALYGYQAMRLVLDAVRRAGGDRSRVIRAALRPGRRESVLGTYSVRARGDVGGLGFAAYAVRSAGALLDVPGP